MKDLGKVVEELIYVGQLGLSLIMPTLLCLGVSYLIDSRLGAGTWVYFPGLVLGLGAGGMTFWKFYRRVVMKGCKKTSEQDRKRASYSRHI